MAPWLTQPSLGSGQSTRCQSDSFNRMRPRPNKGQRDNGSPIALPSSAAINRWLARGIGCYPLVRRHTDKESTFRRDRRQPGNATSHHKIAHQGSKLAITFPWHKREDKAAQSLGVCHVTLFHMSQDKHTTSRLMVLTRNIRLLYYGTRHWCYKE